MFFQNINFLTVFIAAAISMGLGFFWYSQPIFGRLFMKEMKYSSHEGPKNMTRTYSILAIATLLTSFTIAVLLNSLVVVGLWGIIWIAFFMWLAFSLPVAINQNLFGRDSVILLAINTGYQLVALILMTLIIGIFG